MIEDVFTGIAAFFLLLILGVILISVMRSHSDTRQFQRKLFLTAFVLRFLMSLLLYTTPLHESVIGDADDSGWQRGALFVERLDNTENGLYAYFSALLGMFSGVNLGYTFVLGTFFYVTRLTSQISAAALSGFCGAFSAVFAYKTARLVFSEWVGVRSGWWVCVFPGMIIWSAQSVKEPIVILLEQVAIYSCLQLRLNRISLRPIVLCGFSFLLLLSLRFYAAYIVASVILFSLAMPQFGRRRLTIIPGLAVALVIVGPVYLMSGSLKGHSDALEARANIGQIKNFKSAVSTGGAGSGSGSGVTREFDMESSSGLSLATGFGAAHLLLAPFPWQLFRGASARMIMTLPEMFAWWYLFFFGVISGTWNAVRTRLGDVIPMLLFVVTLGLVYSIMFGNIGIVYRQRSQLLPYLFAFGFYGLESRRLRKMQARQPLSGQAPWPAPGPPTFTTLEDARWGH